ncbi:MAG: ABC transporter ATP-binding protein, partial [Bacteroidetes bacterium]|nr:ABC transporter ATP-binding protein [Bacteroidota bacterium]
HQFQELSMSFYKKNETGDLMARITEDVSRVRMFLGPAILYSINLTVLFIMVVTTMLLVNAELTFYVLLPLPILTISIYYVSNLINHRSERLQAQVSKLNSFAQRIFSGIRVIKSYVQEENIQRSFEEESNLYKERTMDLAKIEAAFFPLMLLLIGLSTILTIFIGGIKVMQGEISAGNIAEFVIYINMLTWPVTALGWIASLTQRAAASQKRINEFLHAEIEITSEGNTKNLIRGAIEFKEVSFTFPETGIQVFDKFSLKIAKGEKIAIIGRTGTGKSTLANLIMRMYDVDEGELLMDGVNIKEYNVKYLRSQIGYVPQEAFLFSDTITNNIAFGTTAEDNTDVKRLGMIRKAADDAGLLKDVEAFPDGFDTTIGERGITLSGGQKQRLTIARAIIQNPSILLLDDCLSAVDTKTESYILNKLESIMADKTSLIITHRILSLKNITRIVVIDGGRIVEEGDHHSLLAEKGLYAALYQRQQAENRN